MCIRDRQREHHGVFRVPAEIQHIHRHTAAEVDHAALVNRYKLRVFGGHTENSVVFACAHYKALFTGDAIGSGYIVLMICPEKDKMCIRDRQCTDSAGNAA